MELSGDFAKSISLNWWCEPPKDFDDARYDFRTEVYFVKRRSFKRLIQDNKIEHFKYAAVLDRMAQRDPVNRVATFADIEREIAGDRFVDVGFTGQEQFIYQEFANAILQQLKKIDMGAQQLDDPAKVAAKPDDAYRSVMLEDYALPDAASVLRCLIVGIFNYQKGGLPSCAGKALWGDAWRISIEKGRIVFGKPAWPV